MKSDNKTPIFVVGCPRSGTTLLQSLLAAHPKVYSFPESKFFEYLIPADNYLAKHLGLASRRIKPRLKTFFGEIERPELIEKMPNSLFAKDYPQAFIEILDALTAQQGKQIWIEKTPGHLFHINEIEKFIPNAKFIHLCRQGTDVAASLYEVTQKHPKAWGGRPWSIEKCVDLWVRSIRVSQKYSSQNNHFVLTYEALVDDTYASIEQLCSFISIKIDEKMIQNYETSAKELTLSTVGRTVSSCIKSKNSEKFRRLLTLEQQQLVLRKIQDSQFNFLYS